jgi:hypothetical protein
MKITDIDYYYFQELKAKAEAFDADLLNTEKFIRIGYGDNKIYIKATELDLIRMYETLDRFNDYWRDCLMNAADKRNMSFSDYCDKFKSK